MNKKGIIILWLTVAGVIVALISAYFGYRNDRNQLGGSMNATYQTRLLNNGETKTIVVCVEDNAISLNELPLTPTFENPYKYSLKDFSLSFEVECVDVTLMPSIFYEEFKQRENKRLYSFTKGVLAAFDHSQAPFSIIQLNGSNGHCFIKSKASYNGIQSVFEYYTDVLFFVVSNSEGLPYITWKKKCMESIYGTVKDGPFDIYFCAKNQKPEYNFDIVKDLSNQPAAPVCYDSMDMGNEPCFYELLEPVVVEVQNNLANGIKEYHKIADCKILRSCNTLRYFLTLKSGDCEMGSYLLESRHGLDSINTKYEKYDYHLLNIGKSQKTVEYCYHYSHVPTPVIDQVSLYPQCVNENIVSIKQKNNRYDVENTTEFTIVCCIHYSDNSYTHFVLDAYCTISLYDIGVAPIEVYIVNRKNAVERNNIGLSWPKRLLAMFLGIIAVFGLMHLVLSIIIIISDFFKNGSSFRFKDSFNSTYLSFHRKEHDGYVSKSNSIDDVIRTIITLLTPLSWFFFIKICT